MHASSLAFSRFVTKLYIVYCFSSISIYFSSCFLLLSPLLRIRTQLPLFLLLSAWRFFGASLVVDRRGSWLLFFGGSSSAGAWSLVAPTPPPPATARNPMQETQNTRQRGRCTANESLCSKSCCCASLTLHEPFSFRLRHSG